MIHVAIMASGESRRNWLARRLRADASLKVAGQASTFASLRSLLNESVVDVAMIEVETDSESGMARDWLEEFIDEVPLVILSATPDSWTFNQIVRADRGAILSHDASADHIVHAIRAAAAGLLVFDGSSVPRPDSQDELTDDLTPREIQVLQLLAEGLVNREIAERLNISEHTIKFHIGSILGKLQASSRTEAVTRGLRSGLIEL
jgi:two-component system, NarL family, response regulator YdfI